MKYYEHFITEDKLGFFCVTDLRKSKNLTLRKTSETC